MLTLRLALVVKKPTTVTHTRKHLQWRVSHIFYVNLCCLAVRQIDRGTRTVWSQTGVTFQVEELIFYVLQGFFSGYSGFRPSL